MVAAVPHVVDWSFLIDRMKDKTEFHPRFTPGSGAARHVRS
jgi:hypothetical protein